MSVGHYENFPVASVLCPPELRAPIRAIYHFARTADDLADEGDASAEQRRADLRVYRDALHAAAQGDIAARWPGVFRPLAAAMQAHHLPLNLLDDLLSAFLQDCANPVYPDRAALLDYCRRSANPIGRLLLHLCGIDDALSLRQSDAICTALQLVNFWQDPSLDLPRGRHYIPVADAERHRLDLDQLAQQGDTPASQAMLGELVAWAATLMAEGAPLVLRVPGRMGWELRLVVQGGLRVLERIVAMHCCTLRQRPVLGASDFGVMLWRAARMRPGRLTPGLTLA